MKKVLPLCFVLLLAFAPSRAAAQQFEFHAPVSIVDAGTPDVMRDLAERILPVYEDLDSLRYLSNLSALQLLAGDYKAADDTRQALRERQQPANASPTMNRAAVYDLYAHAKAIEATSDVPFKQAFTLAFREQAPKLSDHDAFALMAWLGEPPVPFREALQKAFDRLRSRQSIAQWEAIDLIWTYLAADAYRSFAPLVAELDAEEKALRYVADEDVLIKKSRQSDLYVHLVRPKRATQALPSLLEFMIDGVPDHAKASAAHGYVGVAAYVRANSKRKIRLVPFERDGAAARMVIAWITKQPWSDGRVGMIGDGYSGFVAWATAKRLPPALKAIATSDSLAPGINFPAEGRIFQNSAYRWARTHAGEVMKSADDDARWNALDQKWYESGKRYRDLDRLAKTPNSVFRRWLNHPSYDRYWQKLIPDPKQFARINIPVLTITGYYAQAEAGALYYFSQHYRNKPDADHTLLIGPYGDGAMQDGPSAVLKNYTVDAAARIDLQELRYQWLDFVLKGAPKPSLLKDHVNAEVMGANEWRHAPSLDAIANGSLRFYLTASDHGRSLAPDKTAGVKFITQTVSLADRSDARELPPAELIGKRLPLRNAVSFASEPLPQPIELSGLLDGRLDFKPNKMDLDLAATLYEQLPDGTYVQLSAPYEIRTSYAKDRMHRRLLRAGERQQLAFTSERMTSRRLQAGSRLVLVLGVIKQPDQQINYGSGKEVSEESIADAGTRLKINWYGSSYIDIPVRK